MLTLIVWVLTLLLLCQGAMSASNAPPTVELIVSGDRIAGVPGSSEWNGLAVDRQIAVPATKAPVETGAGLTFAVAVDDADEALLSVYRAEDITDPALTPVQEDRLDPGDLRWDVTLEPGQYVLALSLTWTGRGDVTTYFGFDVRPAGRP